MKMATIAHTTMEDVMPAARPTGARPTLIFELDVGQLAANKCINMCVTIQNFSHVNAGLSCSGKQQ